MISKCFNFRLFKNSELINLEVVKKKQGSDSLKELKKYQVIKELYFIHDNKLDPF